MTMISKIPFNLRYGRALLGTGIKDVKTSTGNEDNIFLIDKNPKNTGHRLKRIQGIVQKKSFIRQKLKFNFQEQSREVKNKKERKSSFKKKSK